MMYIRGVSSTIVRGACLITFFVGSGSAQDFAREVSQFVGDNARPFLQPIVDGLHTNVHAGFFTSPAAPDGFHVGARIVAMGVLVPDEQKTFTPKPFSKTVEFTYNGVPFLGDLDIAPKEFPTAAGLSRKSTFTGRLRRIRPKGSPYISGVYDFIQRDATVSVGGYQDVSTILLATPQFTVGTLLGTELLVRFLPSVNVPDVGAITSFGIGLKHTLNRSLALPVDLGGHLAYQTLSVHASDKEFDATLDMSTFSAQAFASKPLLLGVVTLTPYTGFGFESGSVDVRYAFADPYVGEQSLSFESGSQFRFIGGLNTKIWKLSLSMDYNAALMSGFSVGLGVEL